MKREGAEDLVADRRVPIAANEEFIGIVNRREAAAPERAAGWDPYEVWRTRVKVPVRSRKDRRRDPGR